MLVLSCGLWCSQAKQSSDALRQRRSDCLSLALGRGHLIIGSLSHRHRGCNGGLLLVSSEQLCDPVLVQHRGVSELLQFIRCLNLALLSVDTAETAQSGRHRGAGRGGEGEGVSACYHLESFIYKPVNQTSKRFIPVSCSSLVPAASRVIFALLLWEDGEMEVHTRSSRGTRHNVMRPQTTQLLLLTLDQTPGESGVLMIQGEVGMGDSGSVAVLASSSFCTVFNTCGGGGGGFMHGVMSI